MSVVNSTDYASQNSVLYHIIARGINFSVFVLHALCLANAHTSIRYVFKLLYQGLSEDLRRSQLGLFPIMRPFLYIKSWKHVEEKRCCHQIRFVEKISAVLTFYFSFCVHMDSLSLSVAFFHSVHLCNQFPVHYKETSVKVMELMSETVIVEMSFCLPSRLLIKAHFFMVLSPVNQVITS